MTTTPHSSAPVAVVTGASRGLGHAHPWSGRTWLAARAGRPERTRSASRRRGSAVVGGDCRGRDGCRAPRNARRRRASARARGPAGQQRQRARPEPVAAAGRLPARRAAEGLRDQRDRPARRCAVAATRLADQPRRDRERELGRGRRGVPGLGGYGSDKAARDQLGAVLGAEEADVRVYAVDPGDMYTDMQQRAFPGEDISDRAEPEAVVPALLRLLDARPASGRYRAADWTAGTAVSA